MADMRSEDELMDAIVWKGKCHVEVQRVPKPKIEHATDVVVKIHLCGLCGSDMHPYHCREQGLDVGTIMGHEFVGYVIETGAEVLNFRLGDRVMSPFTTNCGICFYCREGLTCRCEKGQLFGWVADGCGLHGAQAQFIRVPLADATLAHVPEGVSNEEALLLGDIFSTGFFCAHNAGMGKLPDAAIVAEPQLGSHWQHATAQEDGAVVAVVGCGPVGLMAITAARMLGASKILAIDSLPERLAFAQKLGAKAIDRGQCDPVEAIRAATGGRGADFVLELVGATSALRVAYELVRPGGVISAVGCHTDPIFPFTPAEAYNKNLTLKTGRCPARFYMDVLAPLVQKKQVHIEGVVSHRLPLRDGARGYHLFDSKSDGCIKVVFQPWG